MFMYTDKCLGAYITTYMLQTNITIISWAEVPMVRWNLQNYKPAFFRSSLRPWQMNVKERPESVHISRVSWLSRTICNQVRNHLWQAIKVQTSVDQSLHNQDSQNESYLRWQTKDAVLMREGTITSVLCLCLYVSSFSQACTFPRYCCGSNDILYFTATKGHEKAIEAMLL